LKVTALSTLHCPVCGESSTAHTISLRWDSLRMIIKIHGATIRANSWTALYACISIVCPKRAGHDGPEAYDDD
jgi:hypothetical protein